MQRQAQPLRENDIQPLGWYEGRLSYPGVVRIGAPAGLSFLSALLSAFYPPLIAGCLDDVPVERKTFIRDLRDQAVRNGLKVEDEVDKNIFLLHPDRKVTQVTSFNPERESVVLFRLGEHYETIGISSGSSYPDVKTLFPPGDPFVSFLFSAV